MKKLLFYAMFFIAASVSAQKVVNFSLKSDGTFVSDEGNNYIIVEYEGKTQQELFNLVKANVLTLYNNPQRVLNEIEPSNITIRATSDVLWSGMRLVGGFQEYRAKYNYVFQFKDGKIRVNAPLIDRQLVVTGMGNVIPRTFVSLIDGYFDKNGEVKKNKQKDVSKIEILFNYPINYMLGNLNEAPTENNEDW